MSGCGSVTHSVTTEKFDTKNGKMVPTYRNPVTPTRRQLKIDKPYIDTHRFPRYF
jgi:hypothetical protein